MKEVKKNVTEFLCSNYDVVAYSSTNVERMSREVIEHRMNVKKKAKAVKQKKRKFMPEKYEVLKNEVNKLLAAKFVNEVMYPEW